MIIYLCPGGRSDPAARELYEHVDALAAAGFATQAVDVTRQVLDAFRGDLLVIPEVFGDQLRSCCPGVARLSLVRDAHLAWANVADFARHPYGLTPELRAVLCASAYDEALLAQAFANLEVPLVRLAPLGAPRGDEAASPPSTSISGPRRRIIALCAREQPQEVAVVFGTLAARGALEGWELCRLDDASDDARAQLLQEAAVFCDLATFAPCSGVMLEAMAAGALVVGFATAQRAEVLNAATGVVVPAGDLRACATALEAVLAEHGRSAAAFDDQRAAARALSATRGATGPAGQLVEVFRALAPDQAALAPRRRPHRLASERPSASIVIPAWNAFARTRACLESLEATLGPDDEVIVVDNGSSDETAAGLPAFGFAKVVTNAENHGFAGGCNDGARLARNDVIVFLNNDTVVSPGWLEALLAPFGDALVGASGPRSNAVSGPQLCTGATYAVAPSAEYLAFVDAWAGRAQGALSECARLVGFCLAVRRTAFDEVEGFDERYGIGGFEDDDLCRKLTSLGWKLVIAHEAFVHHEAHATFEANGLDWFALQQANQDVYLDKWSPPLTGKLARS